MNTINEAWFANVVEMLISDMKERGIKKVTIYIGLCETYATLPYEQPATGNIHHQEYSLQKDLRAVKQIREAGLQVEFEGIVEKLAELGIEQETNEVAPTTTEIDLRLEVFVDANADSIVKLGYTKENFAEKVCNLSENKIEILKYVVSNHFKEEARQEAKLLLEAYENFTSITVSFLLSCLHEQVRIDISNLQVGCYVKTEGGKNLGFVSAIKGNKITIISMYCRIGGSIDELETMTIKRDEVIMFMQPKNAGIIIQALDRLQKQCIDA